MLQRRWIPLASAGGILPRTGGTHPWTGGILPWIGGIFRGEYSRMQWKSKNDNMRFYTHEIQLSGLIGSENGNYENFREFIQAETPEDFVIRSDIANTLRDMLDHLNEENRHMMEALLFEGVTERAYSKISGIPQKTINNRKRSFLCKMLKIADRIKTNILPGTLGLYDIVPETIDGITVIKILIAGGPEKPYYIRSQRMSPNGCFMRIGTSTQPMTTAVIEELFSRRVHTTLRNMVSPRQDLTFAQLKIYYEERGLSLNEKFASTLELLTPDGKYNYIAYLLADENGVSVKVAKYAGKDKVDLIENEEYGYCSLIKATNRVLEKMQIENKTFARVTSTKRMEKNLVDAVAMREAIVNAIVHNDYTREIPPVFELYSDRIVMSSYGGLLMGQSEEDFFSCASMPRNRELMRVFKDVGLVEQLGSGMSQILRAYDREVFQISDHFIKVVFPFDEEIEYSSPNSENEPANDTVNEPVNATLSTSILQVFKENPKCTIKQLMQRLDYSESQLKRAVKKLKDQGKLSRIGSDKTGFWQVQDKTE